MLGEVQRTLLSDEHNYSHAVLVLTPMICAAVVSMVGFFPMSFISALSQESVRM